jgi:hypothetical protein
MHDETRRLQALGQQGGEPEIPNELNDGFPSESMY